MVADLIGPMSTEAGGTPGFSVSVYLGARDYFYLRRAGFEDAMPIGTLGKIGLVMLSFITWLAGITRNYGVAIILFSVLITCVLSPFTLLGMKSMKRMQALKPQIDQIMAQHKGDSQKANQRIFALYKEQKVSPLSGCLPLLLQLPIFISLFQALSHFVELRGRSFLWIRDLSLPDRLAELPISIPLLGNYVNVLPIIMAAAMFVQTKMSTPATADQSNPTARIMAGPIMPIMFGIMFYHIQSGLVLYWLTNSLVSLAFYRAAK